MILTIRTEKPEAEISLLSSTGETLEYKKWLAHRELSETIHKVIKELLDERNKDWADITGVIFYAGPGSFTGLRIGAAVSNALAVTLSLPLAQTSGENWQKTGLDSLGKGETTIVIPNYGAEANTTIQKK